MASWTRAVKHWLQAAFQIGDAQKLKQMALENPDLEPLWKDIGQT